MCGFKLGACPGGNRGVWEEGEEGGCTHTRQRTLAASARCGGVQQPARAPRPAGHRLGLEANPMAALPEPVQEKVSLVWNGDGGSRSGLQIQERETTRGSGIKPRWHPRLEMILASMQLAVGVYSQILAPASQQYCENGGAGVFYRLRRWGGGDAYCPVFAIACPLVVHPFAVSSHEHRSCRALARGHVCYPELYRLIINFLWRPLPATCTATPRPRRQSWLS